jgi:hypothetical protein
MGKNRLNNSLDRLIEDAKPPNPGYSSELGQVSILTHHFNHPSKNRVVCYRTASRTNRKPMSLRWKVASYTGGKFAGIPGPSRPSYRPGPPGAVAFIWRLEGAIPRLNHRHKGLVKNDKSAPPMTKIRIEENRTYFTSPNQDSKLAKLSRGWCICRSVDSGLYIGPVFPFFQVYRCNSRTETGPKTVHDALATLPDSTRKSNFIGIVSCGNVTTWNRQKSRFSRRN